MSDRHPYARRTVLLATMHGKEQAIAPVMQEHLGLAVVATAGLDTDRLGTFTGEVPRPGTMRETAIRKARLGLETTGEALALASEGSFGPHPAVPFVAGGIELIAFVDRERDLVVTESMISAATNFAHRVVTPDERLGEFLNAVGFPAHGLIVSPNEGGTSFVKGIRDLDTLYGAIRTAAETSRDGRALVQTDMRAHMNPTRMNALKPLAERLAIRLRELCPACRTPGFGRVDVQRGLPCGECGTPTEGVVNEIDGCVLCAYRRSVPRRDGLLEASAAHCPQCNP